MEHGIRSNRIEAPPSVAHFVRATSPVNGGGKKWACSILFHPPFTGEVPSAARQRGSFYELFNLIEPCSSTKFLEARKIRRLIRCRSGATAVEFAIVAPAFLALLYAILQTALVFFAQQVLQTATSQAARLIMTGQAQTANYTAAQFKQVVCTNATTLFDCTNIYVNVKTFASFSSIAMLNPISNGNFSNSGMSYNPGVIGNIEVVQVFYQWPVWPGPLGFNLSNMNGNKNVLVATAAFRNEP